VPNFALPSDLAAHSTGSLEILSLGGLGVGGNGCNIHRKRDCTDVNVLLMCGFYSGRTKIAQLAGFKLVVLLDSIMCPVRILCFFHPDVPTIPDLLHRTFPVMLHPATIPTARHSSSRTSLHI